MKKLVLLLIVALLALTSCNQNGGTTETEGETATGGAYKVGSYSVTPDAGITEGDEEDRAQINTTIATVVLDADGKIVDVNIDTAQNAVTIKDGAVTVPTDTPTKKEKQDAYNMKGASPIGKEWFEQIEALENHLVGKNLDEVKGIELDENTVVTDEDLLASVTIKVAGYLEAVTKAMENAVDVEGAVAKVGTTSFTQIEDQASDEGGRVTFNTHYGHVALDADGKILNAFIDTAQNRVAYNADGEFEAHTGTDSKKVLKEEYNMKGASPIGKEWYEQAAALEEYVVGLTVDEVNAIETDDAGYLTQEDLVSSVTVNISNYQQIIERAAAAAVEVK